MHLFTVGTVVREAITNSLFTGIARKGGGEGGSTPAQMFLELFLGALYLGKMPKGRGKKLLPKNVKHV